MKVLFISASGEILPIVHRLRKEGTEVKVYVHLKEYQKCYTNILSKTRLNDLKSAIDWCDFVVFDLVKQNEGRDEDIRLLKLFGLSPKLPNVFGPVADKISKPVIGMSARTEELELNRYKGEEIAKECGFDIPESVRFDSLSKGVDFLKKTDDMWVFKPDRNQDLDMTFVEKYKGQLISKMQNEFKERLGKDKISYILQKKVDGVLVSTECWFDGDTFSACNHTFEDKNFLNGDLGIPVGSMNNIVWKAEGKIAKLIFKMRDFLKEAKYIGPIDANCIVSGDKIYFLEYSPRIGWDAIFCLLTLLKTKISDFIQDFNVPMRKGFVSSIRVSIPPYPFQIKELLSAHAENVLISHLPEGFWAEDIWLDPGDKEFKVAGADGIVGVLTSYGGSIKQSIYLLYKKAKRIQVSAPLQYRTDCGVRALRNLPYIRKGEY